MEQSSLNKIKEALIKSPFLELIKKDLVPNDEIILVYLTGSRVTPYGTESSDFDVEVITKQTICFNPHFTGTFYGHKVHWWIKSWDLCTFNQMPDRFVPLVAAGLAMMKYSSAECIIYKNEKYKSFIDFIFSKESLAELSIIGFTKLAIETTNIIKRINVNKNSCPIKYLFPFIDYYAEIAKIDLKELIIKYKKGLAINEDLYKCNTFIIEGYNKLIATTVYNFYKSGLHWEACALDHLKGQQK